MAKIKFGKSANIDAKQRAILFFLAVILIVGAVVGYLIYRRHHAGIESVVEVTGTPGIESIPGVGKASTEYVKLQEQQNIQQAQQAAQQGTSAVPTITRASYTGPGEFQTGRGHKPGCSPEELARARAAGVTAQELRCKACTVAELRAAGYTAGELAAAGYSLADLKNAGYMPEELRQAGFTAAELKAAGFTAKDLAAAGFDPAALAAAGFSPDEIKNAGFNPAVLATAGIGRTPAANVPRNCDPTALRRARAEGVPAVDLRKLNCGAAALRAAGYTAADLRAAGFTPEELKAAGFTPEELKAAGFTAGQLRRAGFSPQELKRAGFSPAELKAAGLDAGALRALGFNPNDLKTAGFTPGELLRAGFSPSDVQPGVATGPGVPVAVAAVTPVAPGVLPSQLAPQCSVEALRRARAVGMPVSELRARGCSASALLAAGYTPADLKAAGFTDDELRAAGVSPDAIAATAGMIGMAAVPPVGATELALAQLQANQEKQLSEQDRQARQAQSQASMISQANALFNTWTPPATQEFKVAEPPKDAPPGTAPPGVVTTGPGGITPGSGGISTAGATTMTTTAGGPPFWPGGPGGPAGGVLTPPVTPGGIVPGAIIPPGGAIGPGGLPPGVIPCPPNCAYVKAGDIMMGVLENTVNSDENSPVLATIVSGKLRGSRLVGQFTLLKEKVLISFSKLNMPGKPATIGISAVAIDPETAHTALADCVDRHYWLRYGTLFASSFLSGLAAAITQSGSQISTGAGGILVTHAPLSALQQVFVALGAVGSQYASVLGSNFTRPPTVVVYAGNSIGVLFMQDVQVCDGCCPDVDKSCTRLGGGALLNCTSRY